MSFYVNCLQGRQFTSNVKPYFLWIKMIMKSPWQVVCCICDWYFNMFKGISEVARNMPFMIDSSSFIPFISFIHQSIHLSSYPSIYPSVPPSVRSIQVAKWLAPLSLHYKVPGLNPTWGRIQLTIVRCFIAQSISLSSIHHLKHKNSKTSIHPVQC